MFFKALLLAGLVLYAGCVERFVEDGSGMDDGSGEISSGDVIQDDLIVGPDDSFIHRQFINLGSGDSVEGSFDPRDEVIEVVDIKGSNNHRIHRTQVVQPGIKSQPLGLDDVEASGMPSGTIIEDHLVQGPDGSEIRTVFMNLGSGDSVEGSFDPRDEIVEIDTIKGSNGAEIRRTQVVQHGTSQGQGRFRRQSSSAENVDGSGEEDKQCVIAAECEIDDECNGGSCIGFLPGRCNCNACLELFPCTSDDNCGGLQGACNATKGSCECTGAYVAHGYASLLDALTNLCNVKTCQAGECLGLKCNKGLCSCPPKQ
jgi:hypothetical protein